MVLGSEPSCRVVSAEAKPSHYLQFERCKISGPLEVAGIGKRYCSVFGGCLEMHGGPKPHIKIPLRGLHLKSAGQLSFILLGRGNCFSFKAEKEEDYWRWVKCLAAELLRQTPLTSIPYLDILGITGTLRRAQSEGCLSPPPSGLSSTVTDSCIVRRSYGEPCSKRSMMTDFMSVRERSKLWEEKMHRGSPLHGGSLSNINEASKASAHLSVKQLCRVFESSTSSLPPRLSPVYLGMKENIPSLFNRRSVEAEETTRGRKQFRISDMKFRHHSNIR